MRRNLFILVAILIVLVVIFQRQLSTHLKIILFITEEFPQIPVKLLGFVSLPPFHDKVELSSKNGKIVGDLFIPVIPDKKPALIVAMGVKTAPKDKPLLIKFSDTLARLGYVVFWPRLEPLDRGESLPEEPETFVESFNYLQKLESVNPGRISYVGFSVGSSTAYVASSDPKIADNVHSLVFFGGQFDLLQYLLSLATKTIVVDGLTIPWNADIDAKNHAKGLLEAKGADQVLKIFDTEATLTAKLLKEAPEDELKSLKRYSPREKVDQFKARIFILHDKSDTLVPYVESVKLNQVLPKEQVGAYHISDLFDHVQPNRPINIGELFKLYGFLYKVLSSL